MPDLGFLTNVPHPRRRFTGPSATEAWDEICHAMGLEVGEVTTPADLSLPTEEESAAFEGAIHEAFEQIERAKPLP